MLYRRNYESESKLRNYKKRIEAIDIEKVGEKLEKIMDWSEKLSCVEAYKDENWRLIEIGNALGEIWVFYDEFVNSIKYLCKTKRKLEIGKILTEQLDILINFGYDMANITKEG